MHWLVYILWTNTKGSQHPPDNLPRKTGDCLPHVHEGHIKRLVCTARYFSCSYWQKAMCTFFLQNLVNISLNYAIIPIKHCFQTALPLVFKILGIWTWQMLMHEKNMIDSYTVNSEIFVRTLFSRIALKDIFATF